MGRPTKINYELVSQTVHEIKKDGEIPSVRKVREKIGHGSNSTILKYLNVWKRQHSPQQFQVSSYVSNYPVENSYNQNSSLIINEIEAKHEKELTEKDNKIEELTLYIEMMQEELDKESENNKQLRLQIIFGKK